MNRRRRIYEGKAKILYEGPEPGTLIQHFKDDATAFNKKKHQIVDGKGVLNNRISEYIFTHLNEMGIPTHFIRRLNMREQLIREVEIVPLEIVVRNVAAGSLAKRLGIEEGTPLPRSIIEFYYKSDELDDPMVSEEHITAFGWASPQEIDDMMSLAIRVNDFLSGLFLGVGIRLVDFKMECGRLWENDLMRIVVADEISPDSCRLWDIDSNEKLDKDRFRRDMGGLGEAYQEVARRLGILNENERITGTGPVPIGKALVRAKQIYLANTPFLRGIHEKSLLQTVLFGLPMLKVNFPAGRGTPGGDVSIVPVPLTPLTTDPGATLGLERADVVVTASLTTRTVELKNPADNNSIVPAVFLEGSDGIVSNPGEPVLPLEARNVPDHGHVDGLQPVEVAAAAVGPSGFLHFGIEARGLAPLGLEFVALAGFDQCPGLPLVVCVQRLDVQKLTASGDVVAFVKIRLAEHPLGHHGSFRSAADRGAEHGLVRLAGRGVVALRAAPADPDGIPIRSARRRGDHQAVKRNLLTDDLPELGGEIKGFQGSAFRTLILQRGVAEHYHGDCLARQGAWQVRNDIEDRYPPLIFLDIERRGRKAAQFVHRDYVAAL